MQLDDLFKTLEDPTIPAAVVYDPLGMLPSTRAHFTRLNLHLAPLTIPLRKVAAWLMPTPA